MRSACALRVEGQRIDWSLLAREAQRQGGLDRLEAGEVLEDSREARAALPLLRAGLTRHHLDAARDRVDRELALAADAGARLVTVLDPDYPINLRLVFNPPPFLFLRGALRHGDARAVAVAGTRTPSREERPLTRFNPVLHARCARLRP